MTLEFTKKQITELQKAQKEKRNAPYHRRIQALIRKVLPICNTFLEALTSYSCFRRLYYFIFAIIASSF